MPVVLFLLCTAEVCSMSRDINIISTRRYVITDLYMILIIDGTITRFRTVSRLISDTWNVYNCLKIEKLL